MEQKINIAELLKDTPKGTKLYSPLYGDVTFEEVTNGVIEIKYRRGKHFYFIEFFPDGRFFKDMGECLLFPSKNCRSWENFKAPWKHEYKHFAPFQKVLVATIDVIGSSLYYNADFYSHWDNSHKHHFTVGGLKLADDEILPYEGNEDLLGKEVE